MNHTQLKSLQKAIVQAILSVLLLVGLLQPSWAQQVPRYLWTTSGGGPELDYGTCVATDAGGNVYATGAFRGTAKFGSSSLVSRGHYDIYLAKYDPQGTLLWIRQAGGPGWDHVSKIVVSPVGDAYVLGAFGSYFSDHKGNSTMTVGNTTLTGNTRGDEMFLAKYDSEGNALWARQTLGMISQNLLTANVGEDLALDAVGSVYITGHAKGPTRLEQITITPTVGADKFFAKYDQAGSLQWVKTDIGASLLESPGFFVNVSATNEILLLGQFQGTIKLDNTTLTAQKGNATYYLAKFNQQGTLLWARQDVLNKDEFCSGLTSSAQGNVVITCYFKSTTTHGKDTFTPKGGPDLLTLSYSAQGAYQWGAQLGSSNAGQGTDQTTQPTTDAKGNIYVCAMLWGMKTLEIASGYDYASYHLVSYTPSGTMRWALPTNLEIYQLAAEPSGQLVATGVFDHNILVDNIFLRTSGGADMFVTKLDTSRTSRAPEYFPLTRLPNIITPNNDGLNDVFTLPGWPATRRYELQVYSRWGLKVYHTDNYKQDWSAAALPAGSYFYYLRSGAQTSVTGWLEVVR